MTHASPQRSLGRAVGAALIAIAPAIAQARAQSIAPLPRALENPTVESAPDIVTSVAGLRALSNGTILVNDPAQHRLVLLDDKLQLVKAVADTTSATGRRYGPYATALFATRADSSLFLNAATLSIFVVDPHGSIVRTMAPPRPSDFALLVGGDVGNPALDSRGRLVYRGPGLSMNEQIRLGDLHRANPPESVAVVRFDFASRRIDTATFLRAYTQRVLSIRRTLHRGDSTTNMVWMRPVMNPAPTVDDWAVLADGRIVVVRGLDYHVDFIDADGHVVTAPKIPFAWRHLSDEDKGSLLDSSKALRARLVADGVPLRPGAVPAPASEPIGAPSVRVSTGIGPAAMPAAEAEPGEEWVDPSEIPDYQPVFAAGAVRADGDGNVWVRTIPPAPLAGGAIYDVIDGRGRLIDRVQVPRGTAIAGFAPNGIVFLARRRGRLLLLGLVHHTLPRL